MEGKELFDSRYDYIDRPTEIEAYRHAVEEAKNLGLSDEKICKYLKTEWMSNEDLKRLAKTLNINCT
jgi:DNA-binding transcriptional regulator YhcF (GntR family)